MQHQVFFSLLIISSFASAMHQPLSLESADQVNAREVEIACLNCLTEIHKSFPGAVNPNDFGGVLRQLGRSHMTTEEKQEALLRLEQMKASIAETIRQREEKEKEEREVLAYFEKNNGKRPRKTRQLR